MAAVYLLVHAAPYLLVAFVLLAFWIFGWTVRRAEAKRRHENGGR